MPVTAGILCANLPGTRQRPSNLQRKKKSLDPVFLPHRFPFLCFQVKLVFYRLSEVGPMKDELEQIVQTSKRSSSGNSHNRLGSQDFSKPRLSYILSLEATVESLTALLTLAPFFAAGAHLSPLLWYTLGKKKNLKCNPRHAKAIF